MSTGTAEQRQQINTIKRQLAAPGAQIRERSRYHVRLRRRVPPVTQIEHELIG